MKRTCIRLAFVLSALPAAAAAQDLKRNHYESYAGIGTGQVKLRSYCRDVGGTAGFSGTCDDSTTGIKVFGGYKFNRYGGVEVGYTNFGDGRADGTLTGAPVTARWKGYGIDLSGIATLPVGNHFELFAKAGLVYWDVKSTTMATSSGTVSDRGFTGVAGAGGTWWFMPQIGLRLQYERFVKVGDASVQAETAIDYASLNVVGRF